jgi:hypothetical protein
MPVRVRSGRTTLAAWRIEVACDQGSGAIVLVESAGETYHRGEGVFLGWSAERLAAAYRALLPCVDEPALDGPQLG